MALSVPHSFSSCDSRSSQLFKSNEAPYYSTGFLSIIVCLCILLGLIAFQALWLRRLNRLNAKRRIAHGKGGTAVDYSLEASSRWEKMRVKAAQARTPATANLEGAVMPVLAVQEEKVSDDM